VTPTDPTTVGTVAAILLGVAFLASWVPAREAVGLDPVSTLRSE
jgi:ABC-type lipoprotein release transport system permease subunit